MSFLLKIHYVYLHVEIAQSFADVFSNIVKIKALVTLRNDTDELRLR